MAEVNKNNSKSVINLLEENLLELQCLIKVTDIRHSAYCEIGRRQLLAFITNHADIGLLYQPDVDRGPIIKRISWYQSQYRSISALCFDPTGSWLLTATIEGSIYIVPVLTLIDDQHVSDHKWSVRDITPIPINHQSSYCRPSALTWWQGITQCSDIGIIGTEEGEIIFINLQNGQWISSTRVDGSVDSLHICQDNNLEVVSLLITNKSQRQWQLILEQRMNGYIFSITNSNSVKTRSTSNYEQYESINEETKIAPSTRSRLRGLKQLSVEKLALIKQKLAETRTRNVTTSNVHRDNENNEGNEESTTIAGTSPKFILQTYDSLMLESLPEDTFLSPQYAQQGQHLFSAYCSKTGRIAIHSTDISIMSLYTYKVPDVCKEIILTERLLFVIGPTRQSLSVISCALCEIKSDEESQFNSEAIIAQFQFKNSKEFIKNIYKITNFKKLLCNKVTSKDDIRDNKQILATKVDDLDVEVPLIDTCIIVTNCGVYKVVFRKPLLNLFIDLALKKKKSDIEKAVRLGTIFGMNIPQLFECAGDIHLTNGYFSEAILLYKLSQCRLLKIVLKIAAAGDTSNLLECLNDCLKPPGVSELTTTTRIHLSNLTVFAFSELILRATPQNANNMYKHFLLFLSKNTFYDERWVVDVAGQACLWKVLHHLITQRGLYAQALEVLIRTVQSYNISNHLSSTLATKYGLLICISEPSIIQAMLTTPLLARSHMKFVLNNLDEFQIFILQRLVMLYDPTSPAVRPLLIRYKARHRTTSHSSQSSQCDSIDSSDMLEENESLIEELVEIFLLVLLTLINKIPIKSKHNPSLIGRLNFPTIEKHFTGITPYVDFKRRLLAAGYGHVALIRNGNIYTWGNSSQGCLGTGPSITRYGPPQPITVFRNMEIEILSVSCGRRHTLAVTNNGVYTWGGSQYGQLGLGRVLQTSNPELIVSLAEEIVVDAAAGQYHSVVLTMDGRVFTWGWGVYGQLGHGNTQQKNVPTLVTSLLGTVVRAIAAGHAHTLTLCVDGNVYAFGCNIFGQLGIGSNIKSPLPIKITLLPEPIIEIATGYFHSLALSTTNKVYTWGSSPQVLRLQTQAQKKSKLLEFQAAAAKNTENSSEFNSHSTTHSKNNFNNEFNDELFNETVTDFEKLTVKTINERKLNCSNESKNVGVRDINIDLIEETQIHLKPVLVDTSLVNGRIVQISTGCHHSALLTKDGTVYCWGRNLDGQIGNGTRRDVNIPTALTHNLVSTFAQLSPGIGSNNRSMDTGGHDSKNSRINIASNNGDDKIDHINQVIKAVRICCGCEFTIAIQPGGTVLSWGSNSIAQLGRSPTKEPGNMAEKLVLIKSSKRIVRLPHGAHAVLDTPSPVPQIPTPIITYQSYDVTPLAGRIRPLNLIEKSYGELTLHHALQLFYGLYNTVKIMDKCEELANYQARSKLALLEQNFSTALVYQFKSLIFDNYRTLPIPISTLIHTNSIDVSVSDKLNDKIKENVELFAQHVEKNLDDIIVECESRKKMKMSVSRSLDCIHVIEQELHPFDCQGGSEELCEDTKSEDMSLDITDGAIDNDTDIVEGSSHQSTNIINGLTIDYDENHSMNNHVHISTKLNHDENIMANHLDTLINDASNIIKYYINEIDDNAQKILYQVLLTIFEFWIANNLPIARLENILDQYIIKLFYPLGLLLFCQSGIKNDNVNVNKNNFEAINSIIINNISTKFCLKVCKKILNHIDQGKSILEYMELFSTLMARHYGPPFTEYQDNIKENKTTDQIMKGIINTISSKSCDPRPFIHLKGPEVISRFFESEKDIIVFTCSHHFSLSIYKSEVIPNIEAELLMMQPLSLPCTAQVLGNILNRTYKMEIVCPRCVLRTIQMTTKNLMVE